MGWNDWQGKRIFVQLKSGGVYTGKVVEVENSGDIVFITMIDKFGERVSFVHSEIIKIVEENESKH